jgi:hypothetical protein
LKKEQNLNEIKIEQYIAGRNPPAGTRIYKDKAGKIKSIVLYYGNRSLLD